MSEPVPVPETKAEKLQITATIVSIIRESWLIFLVPLCAAVWVYMNITNLNTLTAKLDTKSAEVTVLTARVTSLEAGKGTVDRLSSCIDTITAKLETISTNQATMATQLQQLLAKQK